MTRELDPVRAAVYTENPNWVTIAERIAEQPGCEMFPVATVDKIVRRPGELIVIPINLAEEACVIGALIASRDRPFEAMLDKTGRISELRIVSMKKELAPDHFLYAERETAFSTENAGVRNWMSAGMSASDATLTANTSSTAKPDIVIGTAEVNAFFEALTLDERYSRHGDRLVGALFQAAYLAHDFDVQAPTAPTVLNPEHAKAKKFYQAEQLRIHAVQDIRSSLALLEDQLLDKAKVPRPAIHFDKPLDLPSSADITEMRRRIAYPPSDSDIQRALKYCATAIEVLDSLRAS